MGPGMEPVSGSAPRSAGNVLEDSLSFSPPQLGALLLTKINKSFFKIEKTCLQ